LAYFNPLERGDLLLQRRIATCTSANLAEVLSWNWKPQAA